MSLDWRTLCAGLAADATPPVAELTDPTPATISSAESKHNIRQRDNEQHTRVL